MTTLALSGVYLQTVNQSTSGLNVNVSSITTQMVTTGTPKRAVVSQINSQIVTSSTPKRAIASQMVAQILIQNLAATGGSFAVTDVEPQVVYSIGVPETPRQKAWTFDFDGHTFYCLDLAERGCMVYDLTTQSWSQWDTAGYEGHFNFKNGFHWRGGKMVVGGGILDGLVNRLDEDTYLDEEFRPVAYEVNGVIFASTERYIRQYNLRMVGSPGRTGLVDALANPILNMEYSDDNGATWSNPRAVELIQDNNQRIEFRSLGAFRQPGRIFRLYDSGGIKFLSYVMADVEGEQ